MKLVLKPTSREADVRLIAMIHGWHLEAELNATQERPLQIQWIVAADTRVTYVEDSLLNGAYLVIDGPHTEQVIDQVYKGLEVYRTIDFKAIENKELAPEKAAALVNAA